MFNAQPTGMVSGEREGMFVFNMFVSDSRVSTSSSEERERGCLCLTCL